MTSSTGGTNRGRPDRRGPRPADSPGNRRGRPAAGQGGGARGASGSDRPYRERDDRGQRRSDERPRRDERPGRSDGSGSSERPRRAEGSSWGERARRSEGSSSERPRRDGERRYGSDRPARGDRPRDDRSGRPARSGDSDRRGGGRSERGGFADRPARTTRDGQEFKSRQRATRSDAKVAEPPIPDGLDMMMLERSVRAELRSLSKVNAEVVAGHLVAAGLALESDPQRALAHARAARGRASRIAAVREAVGVAAYHAGEWAEAITELRTARRISGDPRNLPLLADCERALGRPAQAVRFLSDPDVGRLDPESRVELFIVVAGARRDMGQTDAALSVLARGGLDRERPRPGAIRLWYVYADVLADLGRNDEAAGWFAASAALDVEGETDAAERAADLL